MHINFVSIYNTCINVIGNNNRIFINLYHFSSIIPQKTIFLDTFLYFNRIPKTGSENFAFLIHQLANVS